MFCVSCDVTLAMLLWLSFVLIFSLPAFNRLLPAPLDSNFPLLPRNEELDVSLLSILCDLRSSSDITGDRMLITLIGLFLMTGVCRIRLLTGAVGAMFSLPLSFSKRDDGA